MKSSLANIIHRPKILMMKILIPVLSLSAFCPLLRAAEPQTAKFSLQGKLPYSVSLSYPQAATLMAHKKIPNGDSIRIKIDDDRDSVRLLTEIHDLQGRKIWSHDFGGNLSNPEGNTITVTAISGSDTLLIEYDGYKWNHHHKLLFVEQKAHASVVREYAAMDLDILPVLKRRKDFVTGSRYFIYPSRLDAAGVEFYCMPLAPEGAPHPFSGDGPTYSVKARINVEHKVTSAQVIKATE